MSKNFIQNSIARKTALELYQFFARLMFWRKGKKVFINSLPKAGTHLITSVIGEIPGVMLSRLHIDPWDINQGEGEHLPLANFQLSDSKLRNSLSKIRNGQVVTGHIPYRSELINVIKSMGFEIIYITRDYGDVLNSRLHYIKGLKRHHLHERLMTEYANDDDRIQALIDGFSEDEKGRPGTDSIKEYLSQFKSWETQEDICQVRFESLVGLRGGGDDNLRIGELKKILDVCAVSCITPEELNQRTIDKKSVTFRSGKIGEGKTLLNKGNL